MEPNRAERSVAGVASWFLPCRGKEALRWASTNGFSLVHLDRVDVAGSAPGAFTDMAEQWDIELGALSVVDLEHVGLRFDTGVRVIDEGLALAAALGIDYVYLPAFGRAELVDDDDLCAMADLLRYAIGQAARLGLCVGTENALPAQKLSALFTLVDDERLELLFDTQNPVMKGLDPCRIAASAAARIRRFVHVKDGDGGLGNRRIGAGTANVAATLATLQRSGFTGRYVLENDYRHVGPAAARTDLQELARLLQTPA